MRGMEIDSGSRIMGKYGMRGSTRVDKTILNALFNPLHILISLSSSLTLISYIFSVLSSSDLKEVLNTQFIDVILRNSNVSRYDHIRGLSLS